MTVLVITLLVVIACMGWAQRREIARLQRSRDGWQADATKYADDVLYARRLAGAHADAVFDACELLDARTRVLQAIEQDTRGQNSGTAQKVNRMAKEALQ